MTKDQWILVLALSSPFLALTLFMVLWVGPELEARCAAVDGVLVRGTCFSKDAIAGKKGTT